MLSNATELKKKLKNTPINAFVNSLLIRKLCESESFLIQNRISEIPLTISSETLLSFVRNSYIKLKNRLLNADFVQIDWYPNEKICIILSKIDDFLENPLKSPKIKLKTLKAAVFALKLLTLLQTPKHDPTEKHDTDLEISIFALDSLSEEVNTRKSLIESRCVRKVSEAIKELRAVQTFFGEKINKLKTKRNFGKNRKTAFEKIKAVSRQFYPIFSKSLFETFENSEFFENGEKTRELLKISRDLGESVAALCSETTFFDCIDFCKPILFCAMAFAGEISCFGENKDFCVGEAKVESQSLLDCFGDSFAGNVCSDILAEFTEQQSYKVRENLTKFSLFIEFFLIN